MTEKKKRFFESMYEIIDRENGRKLQMYEIIDLLNEQQSIINNQKQKIKILQQEINDTQAILEMLTEKLKGWNDE